jgi:hypothetical protein
MYCLSPLLLSAITQVKGLITFSHSIPRYTGVQLSRNENDCKFCTVTGPQKEVRRKVSAKLSLEKRRRRCEIQQLSVVVNLVVRRR